MVLARVEVKQGFLPRATAGPGQGLGSQAWGSESWDWFRIGGLLFRVWGLGVCSKFGYVRPACPRAVHSVV